MQTNLQPWEYSSEIEKKHLILIFLRHNKYCLFTFFVKELNKQWTTFKQHINACITLLSRIVYSQMLKS